MRRALSRLSTGLFIVLSCHGLVACGDDANFAGPGGAKSDDATKGKGGKDGTDGQEEPPGGEGDPATPAPFASLTWFWQCDAEPVTAPAPATDKDVVVEGIGPHQFDRDQLRGTPVTVSGRICEPEQLPRDLVFVVDVSGSMLDAGGGVGTGNDPVDAAGSCGRLTALQQTINSIPAGTARFGLVTFSSNVQVQSTGFFDNADALFANVAPGGTIATVLCAGAGGTNYQAALGNNNGKGAGALLGQGADNATKEIYFISDGQPDAFQDGITEATLLKSAGVAVGTQQINVTIAGIMLKGVDRVIEQSLVSVDSNGKKLYAHVEDAAGLTKVLAELAANEVAGGDVKYRPIGATAYTTLSLMDHLQGFNFTLPSFNIDIDDAPVGLEVLFEYFDRHDNRYQTGGKILWVTDDGT